MSLASSLIQQQRSLGSDQSTGGPGGGEKAGEDSVKTAVEDSEDEVVETSDIKA